MTNHISDARLKSLANTHADLASALRELQERRKEPSRPSTTILEEAREIVDFNPLKDGDFDDDWCEKSQRVAQALLKSGYQ